MHETRRCSMCKDELGPGNASPSVIELGGYCRTCVKQYRAAKRSEARGGQPATRGRPRALSAIPLPDLAILDDIMAAHAWLDDAPPEAWPRIESNYLDLGEAAKERAKTKAQGGHGDGEGRDGELEELEGQGDDAPADQDWEKEWESWMATPEHQYDPARIYTRSTNKFDHSTPLTVGFPREVLALVGKIVSSGVWGEYRSNQDFVRDAVVHRLQTMAGQLEDETFEYRLMIERVQCILDQRAADMRALDKMAESLEEIGDRAADDGNWANLREIIRQTEILADQIGGPWGVRMDRQMDAWRARIPKGQ